MKTSAPETFILFNRQLASTLELDMPLPESLRRVSADLADPALQGSVEKIAVELERGKTFSEALALHGAKLPAVYGALVRAGEATGNLGEALAQAASHDEQMLALQNQVRANMLYPAMLAAGALSLAALFGAVIIPRIAVIFAAFGMYEELPLPTRVLIAAGRVAGHWLFWIGSAAAGAAAFRLRKEALAWLELRQFRIPLWGEFMVSVLLARFCKTFAALLHGGVAVVDALALTKATMRNPVFEEALARAEASVQSGGKIAAALSQSPLFPATLSWLLGAAEERGDIVPCLRELGDYYQHAADRRALLIAKLVEPALMVVVGLLVGCVLVAFWLPMFSLGGMVEG